MPTYYDYYPDPPDDREDNIPDAYDEAVENERLEEEDFDIENL